MGKGEHGQGVVGKNKHGQGVKRGVTAYWVTVVMRIEER